MLWLNIMLTEMELSTERERYRRTLALSLLTRNLGGQEVKSTNVDNGLSYRHQGSSVAARAVEPTRFSPIMQD